MRCVLRLSFSGQAAGSRDRKDRQRGEALEVKK